MPRTKASRVSPAALQTVPTSSPTAQTNSYHLTLTPDNGIQMMPIGRRRGGGMSSNEQQRSVSRRRRPEADDIPFSQSQLSQSTLNTDGTTISHDAKLTSSRILPRGTRDHKPSQSRRSHLAEASMDIYEEVEIASVKDEEQPATQASSHTSRATNESAAAAATIVSKHRVTHAATRMLFPMDTPALEEAAAELDEIPSANPTKKKKGRAAAAKDKRTAGNTLKWRRGVGAVGTEDSGMDGDESDAPATQDSVLPTGKLVLQAGRVSKAAAIKAEQEKKLAKQKQQSVRQMEDEARRKAV
jgi:hypothetical protein